MKVLLVKPYNRSDHIQPSLGLGYLATAIRKDHDVRILDCIKENIRLEDLPARIKEFMPDVVGLQCYTFDLGFISKALLEIKKINKDIVTIIGGPHASALPEETLTKFGKDLDFLFVGEAELGLPKLLEAIEKKRKDLSDIPGLVWRDNGAIRKNPKAVVDDLDSLGFPAWDMIHPENYPEAQHGAFFKNFPIAPIMVTRGCPYQCTFCAGYIVSGRKVRKRKAESVLKEMKMLYDDHGIREFHIIDDNFTMDKAYAKDLLRKLKCLKLDISWSTPNGVRMETLDEELLGLMKETGLYMISLGIESGSDKILSFMKKGTNTKKIEECVSRIHKAGIDMAGFFILGFPTETVKTANETIDFAARLPIQRANFFTYLPFPGTESYEMLKATGELHDVDWEKFYFTNAAYVFPAFTRKELKNLHRRAFAKFYLRPGIIWYHIKSVKSLRHFQFLAKRFMNWIVHT
jgi:radical SAM superfamily enzyme YgiQ (UPF0313 family)